MNITALTPQKILFKGKSESVILPGEQGAFEILPFHKDLVSRLVKGKIYINGHVISILRGIAKTEKNETTIIVERPEGGDEP